MKKILLLLIALTWAFSGFAQTANDEGLLRQWIQTIASDEFGGRKPMTPYEDLTVK